MTQGNPQDQRPWGPRPVGYRGAEAGPKSQWATDDSAYATCLVYGAIALSIVGAIVGGALWFFWEVVRAVLGW